MKAKYLGIMAASNFYQRFTGPFIGTWMGAATGWGVAVGTAYIARAGRFVVGTVIVYGWYGAVKLYRTVIYISLQE